MKKLAVLLFGVSLLSLSMYGLSSHSYYVQIFISLKEPFILLRTAFVMILLAYTFISDLRLSFTRTLLGMFGALLLILGILSMGSPTLLGHSPSYVLIGDALTFIEGGILSLLISIELPARRTWFIASGIYYIESMLASRRRKLSYTSWQATKLLKTQH